MGDGYCWVITIGSCAKGIHFVATSYFSKWVEVESYANAKDFNVVTFVWKNIVTRVGLPRTIVVDNGSQLISQMFKNFCSTWKIGVRFSTLPHPQGNGQAKATSKTISNALKKRF